MFESRIQGGCPKITRENKILRILHGTKYENFNRQKRTSCNKYQLPAQICSIPKKKQQPTNRTTATNNNNRRRNFISIIILKFSVFITKGFVRGITHSFSLAYSFVYLYVPFRSEFRSHSVFTFLFCFPFFLRKLHI